MSKLILENKLGITDSLELARQEEKISKKKAVELFESGRLDSMQAGTVDSLKKIHQFLFEDIYEFAGEIRTVNLAKGNFRFAPVMYLQPSLNHIEQMPQSDFEQIIEKYVEMNIAHSRGKWKKHKNMVRPDFKERTETSHRLEQSR